MPRAFATLRRVALRNATLQNYRVRNIVAAKRFAQTDKDASSVASNGREIRN